jgi:predicted ATPase/DNA-binding XRE family transcriptional regulator
VLSDADVMDRFADHLRRRRLAAGLTQEALAERAGMSARAISDLERDLKTPQRATVALLVRALALPPEEAGVFAQEAERGRARQSDGMRGASPPAGNFPVPLTSFVGRTRELAEVARLLGSSRLLTLTGAGGCGKTRLALAAAQAARAAFADSAAFADLAPLSEATAVAPTVLAAFGPSQAAGPPQTELLARLRDRAVLLLLDNCEHLLDACAALAEAVLRGCPGVRILATSRAPLGVEGEAVYRVPTLSLPESTHALSPEATLATALASEAVQLFAARAALVQPAFAVDGRNAATILAICRRLDGIALALELAAARTRVLAPDQLLARLDDRFRLLVGGRTALRRQQTLHAAIDWSFDLLTEPQRKLFRRLAVFAGGCTLEAAEAVGSGDDLPAGDVLDLVTALVDQSLVQVERGGEEARYRLLETLRQYGRERLAAGGEAATFSARHACYYLALAEAAEPALNGPEQAAWLDRLEAERDNIRAALAWYLDAAEGTPGGDAPAAEAAVRLAGAIERFWFLRAKQEGLAWLERALACGKGAPAGPRAKALHAAAWIASFLGDARPERWQPLAEACLAEYRRAGDRLGTAQALYSWGLFLHPWDHARGAALAEQGLCLAREAGEPLHIAWALVTVGFFADLQRPDERARARAAAEEALPLLRQAGDTMCIVSAQNILGRVALHEGDCGRAGAAFTEELAGVLALKNLQSRGTALKNLGDVSMAQGDPARARAYYEQAVAQCRETGTFPADLASAFAGLGRAAMALGDPSLALASLRESLRAWQRPRTHDQPEIACVLEDLGRLAAARGQAECAFRLIGSATAIRDATGAPLTSDNRAKLDHDLEPAGATLGREQSAAASSEGRAMSLEQAFAYALSAGPGRSGWLQALPAQ